MKSVIGEIYRGERQFGEKIKETERYWELCDKISELVCEILEYLGGEMKSVMDELEAAFKEREAEAAETRFKEGFKTGLLTGIETAVQNF